MVSMSDAVNTANTPELGHVGLSVISTMVSKHEAEVNVNGNRSNSFDLFYDLFPALSARRTFFFNVAGTGNETSHSLVVQSIAITSMDFPDQGQIST